MTSSIPPASMDIIMSSPIDMIPLPVETSQPSIPVHPVVRPIMPARTLPMSSTAKTFIPAIAVIRTATYGITFIRSVVVMLAEYGDCVPDSIYSIAVIIAAGSQLLWLRPGLPVLLYLLQFLRL